MLHIRKLPRFSRYKNWPAIGCGRRSMQQAASEYILASTQILNRPTIGRWLLFWSPSVGIYIGPLLGTQIGWPNNVIVKLTVVPLQGRWLLFWSALCRHLYRPAVGSANRHAVATTVSKRLAKQRYCQTNRWPTAGPVS